MIASLQPAGLSEKESLVYLDLRSHGASQTGKMCSRTKIPSSYIYTVLECLLEKGLVSFQLVNNVKVFSASSPDVLRELLEEKEKIQREQKEELLASIEKMKTVQPPRDMADFKYFHGIRGVKSLYLEVSNSWKKGDEYWFASAPRESFEMLEGFFLDVVHKKRVKDGVRLKMLINADSRKYGPVRKKMKYTEVRYLDINTSTEYGVVNDLYFIVSYGKKPYGLLIRDANFAHTYKEFFRLLWRNAVKV